MNISEIRKILDLHFDRAEKAFQEILNIQLDSDAFLDFEHIKTIDTFIYRFSKIQDYMGEKFFPSVLSALGEFKSNMSLKDMLNRLERLELIPSANKWMGYREIRNTLTHEYPDNEDEVIEGIQLALTAYQEIKSIYRKIAAGH
jgi:hypothetical protein